MIWQFLRNNRENLIDYLADELINSRLIIFLGSGVSLSFNLPTWDQLVEKVCEIAKVEYKIENDKYILMNYCKAILTDRYIPTVKSVLYDNYSPILKELASSDLLVALGALIIGSKRGKVNKVITYNYDDILETYLLYHGYMPNVISQLPYDKINADIDIYHPHGYIPRFFGSNSDKIVLDQDSYSETGDILDPIYRDIESNVLSSTCLFIGISGNDQNLNKLIVNSKKNHISNVLDNKILGFIFKLDSELESYEEKSFKDKGIYCIRINDHSEISDYLSQICQRALIKYYPNFHFSSKI